MISPKKQIKKNKKNKKNKNNEKNIKRNVFYLSKDDLRSRELE